MYLYRRVWTHGVLRPRSAARRCLPIHQYFEWCRHRFFLLLCVSAPRGQVCSPAAQSVLLFCRCQVEPPRDTCDVVTFCRRNAKDSSLWTPGAWYWMVLLLAGLEAMAGPLYFIFYPVISRNSCRPAWLSVYSTNAETNNLCHQEYSKATASDPTYRFLLGHRHAPHTPYDFLRALLAPVRIAARNIVFLF